MDFGKLDINLNVENLDRSLEFYQKLGFKVLEIEDVEIENGNTDKGIRVAVIEHDLLRRPIETTTESRPST